MKIEIIAPLNPCRDYEIRTKDGNRIRNSHNAMYQYDFCEDEIQFLLGDANYNRFKVGKYEFDIPKFMIDIVSDNLNMTKFNPSINKLSYQWQSNTY
jgi:hypothetical protein